MAATTIISREKSISGNGSKEVDGFRNNGSDVQQIRLHTLSHVSRSRITIRSSSHIPAFDLGDVFDPVVTTKRVTGTDLPGPSRAPWGIEYPAEPISTSTKRDTSTCFKRCSR